MITTAGRAACGGGVADLRLWRSDLGASQSRRQAIRGRRQVIFGKCLAREAIVG